MSQQPPGEGDGVEFKITLEAEQRAGVWANFASVSHSDYEFTLDFVRLDFPQKKGIVVARVSVSPLFVTQLIDALQTNWDKYARRAVPREVYGDEIGDHGNGGEGSGDDPS